MTYEKYNQEQEIKKEQTTNQELRLEDDDLESVAGGSFSFFPTIGGIPIIPV